MLNVNNLKNIDKLKDGTIHDFITQRKLLFLI
jgi:hypothetical protein